MVPLRGLGVVILLEPHPPTHPETGETPQDLARRLHVPRAAGGSRAEASETRDRASGEWRVGEERPWDAWLGILARDPLTPFLGRDLCTPPTTLEVVPSQYSWSFGRNHVPARWRQGARPESRGAIMDGFMLRDMPSF